MSNEQKKQIAVDAIGNLIAIKNELEKLPTDSINFTKWWSLYSEIQDFINTKTSN
jgi:hypothetical protein